MLALGLGILLVVTFLSKVYWKTRSKMNEKALQEIAKHLAVKYEEAYDSVEAMFNDK